MDVYNYIEKNKDFEIEDLNQIDALIFTRLSYIHFELLLEKLPITIKNLSKNLSDIKISKNDLKLVNLMQKTLRYRDIVIKRCEYIFDKENEEQFTAITVVLPNKDLFIAFRGTTKNIYDFKEDMNMSYKIVPSCYDATKYVNDEKKYNRLYLGGHSKGGHLAMYSGTHAKWFVQRKIKKIYNFDGPGFLKIDKDLKRNKNKIINYFPENSIVGRIMHNCSEIIPIKTNKQGIESHNLYNWKIEKNDFIIGKLTNNSNEFHRQCLKVIEVISKEKREEVMKYFFNLITRGEIKSVKELNIIKIKSVINKMPHLEKEEKQVLMDYFKILIKCAINNPIKNPKKLIKRKKKKTSI